MDRLRFEEAIAENPYDRATRLVYADWLEEHGHDDEALVQREWTKEWQDAKGYLENLASKIKMEVPRLVKILKDNAGGWGLLKENLRKSEDC